MANNKNTNLIWIDLEMTGLNPKTDKIIEIASIVTDSDLNILAEGPNLVIHQSDEVLENMNDWCKITHKNNGLIDEVKKSLHSEASAEKETLDFLKKWVKKGASPICGNTIAQDKRFLFEYMPELYNFFHYRYIDVSTIKELINRWKLDVPHHQKLEDHKALGDIRNSIKELQLYKDKIFIK